LKFKDTDYHLHNHWRKQVNWHNSHPGYFRKLQEIGSQNHQRKCYVYKEKTSERCYFDEVWSLIAILHSFTATVELFEGSGLVFW